MSDKALVELRDLYFSMYGCLGKYEYPIEHPAFAKWKAVRSYALRLKGILSVVGAVKGKRVLDIGCAEGAFSHHLAKRGAKVVGVDYCSWRTELAEGVSKLYELPPDNPMFLAIRFERYLKERPAERFDFILFLSLFHHFLRRGLKSTWQKMELVSQRTDMMFLEADLTPIHCRHLVRSGHKQSQMKEVIPSFIVQHSGFRAYEELPTTRTIRPFFVFTK